MHARTERNAITAARRPERLTFPGHAHIGAVRSARMLAVQMPEASKCRRAHALAAFLGSALCAATIGACGASTTSVTVTSIGSAGGAPVVVASGQTPTRAATPAAATSTSTASVSTVATRTATTPSRTKPPSSARAFPSASLTGKTVGIDPGHNGRNYTDPDYINRLIWNGREMEPCNTTGTETDGGYTESLFNWNVATYLAKDLTAEGAKIILTRHSNDGVGPCVNTRSFILNRAHVDVAIAIHADGAAPSGRGFAILEPVADKINNRVIGASERFGLDLRARFLAVTGMPESTYDGTNGIVFRDDLAGLNLTTVPKVYFEVGNMRNATDAALLVTSSFQRRAANAIAQAITLFLTGRA